MVIEKGLPYFEDDLDWHDSYQYDEEKEIKMKITEEVLDGLLPDIKEQRKSEEMQIDILPKVLIDWVSKRRGLMADSIIAGLIVGDLDNVVMSHFLSGVALGRMIERKVQETERLENWMKE